MRIGIDLGGTKIETIVLSDGGDVLFRKRIDAPRGDYGATISAISDLVADAETEAGCSASTPVGIGIPGTVSPETGLVKNANSTWLIGHPLDKDLQAELGRPVRVANDANCFAVSEAVDGAGKDYGTVFGVILGTGVGGGIAIDGRAHVGPNAVAGEWGHNPLPWPVDIGGLEEHPGPQCYCGKFGCIETFLSGPGLSADFKAAGGEDMSAEDIAALDTNPAHEALDRYADRLARALSGVINALDPDVVVFGGGLSNLSVIYETVPGLLGRYVFSDVCTTPLIQNQHGDSSGVRGAAWLWPAEQEEQG